MAESESVGEDSGAAALSFSCVCVCAGGSTFSGGVRRSSGDDARWWVWRSGESGGCLRPALDILWYGFSPCVSLLDVSSSQRVTFHTLLTVDSDGGSKDLVGETLSRNLEMYMEMLVFDDLIGDV